MGVEDACMSVYFVLLHQGCVYMVQEQEGGRLLIASWNEVPGVKERKSVCLPVEPPPLHVMWPCECLLCL